MPSSDPSTFFERLGNHTLQSWKAANFNPVQFADIATDALQRFRPDQHVHFLDLFDQFLTSESMPNQSASGFGQPELIVFEHSRFYIQVLVWMDGSTDVHQHLFDGAFHVMHGSSIHSRFVFEGASEISAHLRTGNLRMTSTELLEKGATVPIHAGPDFIHALFHLDSPSLTVVVRTHTSPGAGPQFTYLAPHFAVDPFLADTLTMRRKQILDTLEALNAPGYADAVVSCIDDLDFERGFFILQNCAGTLMFQRAWDSVFERFRERHGAKADLIPPTLQGIQERDHLISLRREITDPELRFYIALKLNVPSTEDRMRLIKMRFNGSPKARVARWERELEDFTVL